MSDKPYKVEMKILASIGPPYYFLEYFGTEIWNVKKYLGGEKCNSRTE